MILEYDNYVCENVIDNINQSIEPFIDNSKFSTYNREGKSVFVSKVEQLKDVDNKILEIMSKFSNDIFKYKFKPKFEVSDTGYEYHRYYPGDVCSVHSDGEVELTNNFLRCATVILFLTNNNDGQIVFPNQNKEITPKKGKLIAFPPYGFYPHYTKPSKINRDIVMTWFFYKGISFNK